MVFDTKDMWLISKLPSMVSSDFAWIEIDIVNLNMWACMYFAN
jgi:hypothetical protein